MTSDPPPDDFIARWRGSGASERSNCQMFLAELAELLGQARPDPARGTPALDGYCFERPVPFRHTGTTGRIDLYRRGCFVLEAKQGSPEGRPTSPGPALAPARRPGGHRRGTAVRGTRGWDDAMLRARGQAEAYARALPGRIPAVPRHRRCRPRHRALRRLLPHRQDLRPLPRRHPLPHPPRRPARRRRSASASRLVWTDPDALDPAAHRRPRHPRDRRPPRRPRPLLRGAGPRPRRRRPLPDALPLHHVRRGRAACIPENSFQRPARPTSAAHPEHFAPHARGPLGVDEHRRLLRRAPARRAALQRRPLRRRRRRCPSTTSSSRCSSRPRSADWREVEPAIFGTLLERALDPARAPQARRPLHPARLRRAPRPAHRHRAAARRLGERPRRRRHASPTTGKRPEAARRRCTPSTTSSATSACSTPPAAPAISSTSPSKHMKRLEGEVSTSSRSWARPRPPSSLAGHHRRPAPVPRHRAQPARRRHRRARAVDRLPAMALPHPRQAPPPPSRCCATSTTSRTATPCSPGTPPPRASTPKAAPSPAGTAPPPSATRSPASTCPTRKPASRSSTTPTRAPPTGPRPTSSSATRRSSATSACARPSATATPRPSARAYPKDAAERRLRHVLVGEGRRPRPRLGPDKRTGTRRFGLITTNSLRQTFNRRVVAAASRRPQAPALARSSPSPTTLGSRPSDGAAVRIAMTVGAAGIRGWAPVDVVAERTRRRRRLRVEGSPSRSERDGITPI